MALFFVEKDDKNLKGTLPRQGGVNWKPGIEIFSQVSVWIVVPIVLAVILGKMLDKKYGTEPMIFLVFAGAGFLFTCIGIVRVVKKYIKEMKDLAEKKSKEN